MTISKMNLLTRTLGLTIILAAGSLFCSCNYNVPITAKPTRKIDERLLGTWTAKKEDETATMQVCKWDDFNYVVWYSDHAGNLCRVFHSDLAGTAFVSVQDLSRPERKYCYFLWSLSPDGKTLSLRLVNDKVIPDDVKDSESVQRLLKQNLQNPKLFLEGTSFTKEN
jgi:hypothetical protein